ncbi:MAG: class I SAM-dependent methyltransferase [Candidatus Scatosoma sp.]
MEKTSITALMSAFVRAFHAENETRPVFDDFAARSLLTDEEYGQIAAYILSGADFFAPGKKDAFNSEKELLRYVVNTQLAPTPLCRAAFAENALKTEIRTGAEQYVILGAGLDSFALRETEFLKTHYVYEADAPASQRDKIARLTRAFEARGESLPERLRFVSLDFTKDDLAEKLTASGFDAAKKTFFSWLGVTYYLTEQAINRTLESLSRLCAEGSAVVFDVPDENYFTAKEKRIRNTIAMAAAGGEAMQRGYSYAETEALLEKHGFLIYEYLTPDDVQRTLIDARGADMQAFEHTAYVLAVKQRV